MFLGKLSTCITFLFYLLGTTLLCAILNGSYRFYELYHSSTVPTKERYEYIIVGTGTAGSVIASGIPSDDVLIVEAGSMRPGLMDVPLLQPLLQGTSYDWRYRTEVQGSACRALNENRSSWSMGKVFGGTQMFNNMVQYRAERGDYRGWFAGGEEALDEFMTYFERWKDDDAGEKLHFETDLGSAFIAGAKEAGLEEGLFYRPNVMTRNGRRWTGSHHYLTNPRKGHELILNGLVTEIKTEKQRAIGIILRKGDKSLEVKASKGVILAAGAIGSAKILLQSGIGPTQHLKNVNINPKLELPVGENLQDHITTGMDLILLSKKLPMRPWNLIHPINIGKYLFNNGQESSLAFGGCEALGFVNLGSNFTHELGFMVLPVGITIDTGLHLRNLINLQDEVWKHYFQFLVDQNLQSVTILPIVLHPKSIGHVRLRDSNPESTPLIQPNYLAEQQDIQTLITGIKILKQIVNQPAMQAIGAEFNPKPFPGCEDHPFESDSYWECYVRALTLTLYHPVGTCRMGPAGDPGAVVSNEDFRVHQMDSLYVVDGSIMPNLPSGNPNSVIVALAKYFLKKKFAVP